MYSNENYGRRDILYTVFLKESLSIIPRSNQLKWLVVGIADFNISYLFYSIYLSISHSFLPELDMIFLGGVFFLLMIVRATFSFLSGLLKKIPYQKLNYAATLILSAGYVVMWVSQNLVTALVGVIFCEVCIGLWFRRAWRNDVIPTSHRATLLLFISTLTSFVTSIFVLGIGTIVDSLRRLRATSLPPGLPYSQLSFSAKLLL